MKGYRLTLLVLLSLLAKYTPAQSGAKPLMSTLLTAQGSGNTRVHAVNIQHLPATNNIQQFKLNPVKRNVFSLVANHYSASSWSTFSFRYCNSMGNDWLLDHNLVTIKSIVDLANKLQAGIDCHYTWAFVIGGNGINMVLNKLPIKIAFGAVLGGGPIIPHK